MPSTTVTIFGQSVDRRVLIYGGTGAAAFVAWRYWQARQSPPADATAESDLGDSWAADNAPGGAAVRPAAPAGQTDMTGNEFTTPRSDAEWSQSVIEYMTTIGYDGPTIASALGAFLGGQFLSATQAGYVRTGMAVFGRPPQHPELAIKVAAAPAPTKPAPAPAPKPAPKPSTPTKTRTHTVVRGETLSGIARKYGTSVARLVQLNRIKDPNRIYAGQKLVIG